MENEKKAPTSKALGVNPKDIIGSKKLSFSKIPPISLLWEALAMMDGAGKYDPYNWRANKVQASIYIDAALRHIFAWFEGEEMSDDAGCHHLGHARACLGILLDAQATGNLVDDRPLTPNSEGVFSENMKFVSGQIPAMQERHAVFHANKYENKMQIEKPNLPVENKPEIRQVKEGGPVPPKTLCRSCFGRHDS